ncbi:MAG: class I SAM-dependent methyltransferase [Anaerolineae bacterium]|nr:class I SAM-dependent methyltransferase [Anaerolineae bacterium]
MTSIAVMVSRYLPRRAYNQLQDAYFWLRSLPYLGRTRECPCCGWHLRHFKAVRGAHSVRVLPACPRCHATERHRWLWHYLAAQTDLLTAPTRLLHFAPEFCFYRRFQHMPHIHVVGTDLVDHRRINMRQDIMQLAFADDQFDAIICSHVLEHVPDDRRALAELFRVLKPGGWAALNVPVRMNQPTYENPAILTPAEREQHFGQSDHVRWYGYDFVDRVQAAGFVVTVEHTRDLSPDVIERYGLEPDAVMFFCTRPGAN